MTENDFNKTDYGYVYLIEGQQCYKVGRSVNVPERTQWFDLTLPFDIRLIDFVGVAHHKAVEAALHRLYAPFHLKGEWFKLGEQQVANFKDDALELEKTVSQYLSYRTRDGAIEAAKYAPEAAYIARVNRRYVYFPTSLPYQEAVARFASNPSIVGVVLGGRYHSFSGK